MRTFSRGLLILLICFLFILPANTVLAPETDISNDQRVYEVKEDTEGIDEIGSRSSLGSRANFEISSTTPVTMPEVYGSWNQSDWTGGPGQDMWNDPGKFNYTVDINYSTPGDHLELGDAGKVEDWTQKDDMSQWGRRNQRIIYSTRTKMFYCYGGQVGNFVSDRTYRYNPNNDDWTRVGFTGEPDARASAFVVWDNKNNLMWVYGGRNANWGTLYNDFWAYDPVADSWTQKATGLERLCNAAGAFNPNRNEIIMYGGFNGTSEYPSNQVFVYNITFDFWEEKHNYTPRYYHDAVWSPKTNSMLVYGGTENYTQSGGYVFVNELNEYFPENDTWTNRTPTGNRIRHILAWDTHAEVLMLTSGADTSVRNDMWHYDVDTDTWTQKLSGPPQARDYSDGDWDSTRNIFMMMGGRIGGNDNSETWIYSPYLQSYPLSGDLVSSVFNPGSRFNPKTVLFNTTKPLSSNLGTQPVKIWLAGSVTSASEANKFIGPTGTAGSYFYIETGQNTHSSLTGVKYLAYKVNLSTENKYITPNLNWIRIDYFTYPSIYNETHKDITNTGELPLRFVNWTSVEPEGTSIEIYFRQSYADDLASKNWEKVERGQNTFGYKGGKYFQYKAVLKTTEPGYTPELSTIKFVFNELPSKPKPLTPLNDTWSGDSKPTFTWEFNDPDIGDYQTGFELQIGLEHTFSDVVYISNIVSSLNCSHTINTDLDDGKYYWHARTIDNYGSKSDWSQTFIVKIDTKKPSAPKIDSFSHPFDSTWYSDNKPRFHWTASTDNGGIAGYSYSFDQSPSSVPDDNISITQTEFDTNSKASDFKGLVFYDAIPDGIWYFHLKAVDNLGYWSDVSTKMIRIDTSDPDVNDTTNDTVIYNTNAEFNFALTDSGAGVNEVTLYWSYEHDDEFMEEILVSDDGTNYNYIHKLKATTDDYIDYFIEATDNAEGPNKLLYPSTGYKRITLFDDEPPEITDITGSKTHNKFQDLEIVVIATDNVGISSAMIYFNEQKNGEYMVLSGNNVYKYKISRVDLEDYAGYRMENEILYRIIVTDFQNNTVTAPGNGDFNITLEDKSEVVSPPKKESKEDEGISKMMMMYIVAIIVIVIVVALMLFFFVKKKSEEIGADRHELRMAIADVQEAAAAKGLSAEELGVLSSSQSIGGVLPQELPPFDVGDGAGGQFPQLPVDGQQAPAGYLPETAGPSSDGTLVYPEVQPEQGGAPAYVDESQYIQQAGLMTGIEPTPTPAPSVPEPVAEPQTPAVEVDKGLYISLPSENGAAVPEQGQDTGKQAVDTRSEQLHDQDNKAEKNGQVKKNVNGGQ